MTQKIERGQLIVLSGPSGVGKSTVIAQLLEKKNNIHFSVSFTTRKPRPAEIDGVSYNFVEKEQFEAMIARDELLEYAQYVENYYGTSQKVIDDQLEEGIDVLLDIEVQGAAKVRARCPEALFIFIAPPSFQELRHRLEGRNTDSDDVIAGRLEKAKVECQEIPNYDYLVINDQVSNAVDEISAILTANQCRTKNRIHLLLD